MKLEIETLLKDYERSHSRFQIEHFIIGSTGDTWHQYKHALREIENRYRYLNELKDKKDIAGVPAKIKRWFFLRFSEKTSNIKNGDNRENDDTILDIERELNEFVKIAKKIKKDIGEITDERRQQLEFESWKNKGLKMAAIDILSSGNISNQTYDFIFSLPKKAQLEIFHKLKDNPPMNLLGFEPDEIRALSNQGRGT
jgi:hypothetical protein